MVSQLNLIQTQKRRTLQPLLNALEKHVGPCMEHGVLLCVSGGGDSMALMEAMAAHPLRHKGRVGVVSVDHQTRFSSKAESHFVRGRAKLLGFEAYALVLPRIQNQNEHNLRLLRYEALSKLAKEQGFSNLVLAHHQDDQVEGYLMHLYGFGGGKEGASLAYKNTFFGLNLIRPFLDLTKQQLLSALFALGQRSCIFDPLDKKSLSKRAFIRNDVLPKLKLSYGPLKKRLLTLAKAQQEDNLSGFLHTRVCLDLEKHSAHIGFEGATLKELEMALRYGLSQISSKTDLRSARPGVKAILETFKNTQALDQNGFLVTLPNLRRQVCLPGARAILTQNQIILNRIEPG